VETAPDGSTRLWPVMQLLRGSTLEALLNHAKVLDFGIAILRGAGALPRLTQVDRTVGTPAYMSPEQCLGQVVTAASDIYSLGCLLLELLTGDTPFLATADTPLRSHHLNTPAPSARSRRAGVPAELDTLVSSMMAKGPGARPTAALLDSEHPSEAISLLEDGIERASHDPARQLQLRHLLGATLFYAGEYTRAAAVLDIAGGDYRRYFPPNDPEVLDCAYHAGHAYAETGKPGKALPQLRFYVQNADTSADGDEARKLLESRFVIAQLLAADGYPDQALAELQAVRPLLAEAFGPGSTQVRNLDKQAARLRTP
jgi:hypothetical protein